MQNSSNGTPENRHLSNADIGVSDHGVWGESQISQVFNFEGDPIRVEGTAIVPQWVAMDVCNALGVKNHRQAVARLDADEKDDVILNDAMGRPQDTIVINESGLYSLILTSRKPEARRFKKWVTSVVLPAIRKTGGYSLTSTRVQQLENQIALQSAMIEQMLPAIRQVASIAPRMDRIEETVSRSSGLMEELLDTPGNKRANKKTRKLHATLLTQYRGSRCPACDLVVIVENDRLIRDSRVIKTTPYNVASLMTSLPVCLKCFHLHTGQRLTIEQRDRVDGYLALIADYMENPQLFLFDDEDGGAA